MNKWSRENLKFSTPIEKEVHKKVSGIRYGEKLTIKKADGYEKKQFETLVRKSACFYHIDIYCRWSKEKDEITITVGGL